MGHSFKIGDKVEVLDDTVKGKVIAIEEDKVVIETEDGFPMTYAPSELVRLSGTATIRVSNSEVFEARKEKQLPKKKRPQPIKPKDRNAPKMEVDLHIHNLVASTRNMSNYDMLDIQMETAKRQLEFAIRKRIPKVVFIHGVGEGVLKQELEYLFGKYENVKYYEADYQKYGLGATEVYIYQNP